MYVAVNFSTMHHYSAQPEKYIVPDDENSERNENDDSEEEGCSQSSDREDEKSEVSSAAKENRQSTSIGFPLLQSDSEQEQTLITWQKVPEGTLKPRRMLKKYPGLWRLQKTGTAKQGLNYFMFLIVSLTILRNVSTNNTSANALEDIRIKLDNIAGDIDGIKEDMNFSKEEILKIRQLIKQQPVPLENKQYASWFLVGVNKVLTIVTKLLLEST